MGQTLEDPPLVIESGGSQGGSPDAAKLTASETIARLHPPVGIASSAFSFLQGWHYSVFRSGKCMQLRAVTHTASKAASAATVERVVKKHQYGPFLRSAG